MKVLDTDILIDFLRNKKDAVAFVRQHADQCTTTCLNAAELYEGAAASQDPAKAAANVAQLLAGLRPIPFGPRHARAYGRMNHRRRRSGLPGDPIDVLIASVALGEAFTIVTRNRRDFEGHEGLTVEAW